MTNDYAGNIVSPLAELPDWARKSINLASPRLGAKGIMSTDEFFAPLERMLNPEPAVFYPGRYDDNGKWMDGWETRRKRTTGHDHCIIKLGRPGKVYGFDADTSHFTGNYAPAIRIEGTNSKSDDPAELAGAEWLEILPAFSLKGNSHHLVRSSDETAVCSHLRIHIYPDGGLARLRVYGQPVPSWEKSEFGLLDLVAMENGGRAVAWNDAHFGAPPNMLLPGKGLNMGDGWETRRRREPGNDWAILALGGKGIIREIEVDTAYFKGNFADRCSIQAANAEGGTEESLISQSMFWEVLLPEQKLSMDTIHRFRNEVQQTGPVTHVRLNIFPDGGISRLRLWGQLSK